MNLISKISLSISGVSLLTLAVARIFLGHWIVYLWWPFGLFIAGLFISFIFNFRFYWSILMMKTTKEGMSFGLSIVIALALISSIGYLGHSLNTTIDFTEEKLFSLSDQTKKVLNSMKEDGVRFTIFFKGKVAQKAKNQVQNNLKIFKQEAPFIKIQYYDVYKNNKKAQIYLTKQDAQNDQALFMFVEYRSKKQKVKAPFDESKILSVLSKISRKEEQYVYYTTGHGEKDFNSTSSSGLSFFKNALENSGYSVKEWNFVQEQSGVPKNAATLMILGPTKTFFEQEIRWIQEYIKNKGNLFIALDPGARHNLTPFLKKDLGIVFKNNYIISALSRFLGRSETSVLGLNATKNSPVMKGFRPARKDRITLVFDEASEVQLSTSASYEQGYLLKSDPSALIVKNLFTSIQKATQRKSRNFSVYVQEQKGERKSQGFSIILFGDSDFLSNRNWDIGDHQNFSLQIMAYLSNQNDLMSIPPKSPKGTKVTLSAVAQYIFVIFSIALPLIFFIGSGVFWYLRKRN